MKKIQVIIRTPAADERTDGRTGWIQYTLPPLNCIAKGIINDSEFTSFVIQVFVIDNKAIVWLSQYQFIARIPTKL